MRNKILVVESDVDAREQLEQSLQLVLEEGGELFFTQKREEAIAILEKEKPMIIFVDQKLAGEELYIWKKGGSHLILTLAKGEKVKEGEDYLFKPFHQDQLKEKCRPYLNAEAARPILPM